MEKIFYVIDELMEDRINEYLANGWSVKDIKVCGFNSCASVRGYIVLEKKNEQGEQN